MRLNEFDLVGFLSNILAVILGIIITFSIQGVLDEKAEKKDVQSALSLVKDELEGCLADMNSCAKLLDEEGRMAALVLEHPDSLKKMPQDSIALYWSTLTQAMILSLPKDALELLENSSLFQKIGDNDLSLKIIKAYDFCNVMTTAFNQLEEKKGELMNQATGQEYEKDIVNENGNVSITKLSQTPKGHFAFKRLCNNSGDMIRAQSEYIRVAIEGINNYIEK